MYVTIDTLDDDGNVVAREKAMCVALSREGQFDEMLNLMAKGVSFEEAYAQIKQTPAPKG